MDGYLTVSACLVLVTAAAYVIHRLDLPHADETSPGTGTAPPGPVAAAEPLRRHGTTGDRPGAPPATRPRR